MSQILYKKQFFICNLFIQSFFSLWCIMRACGLSARNILIPILFPALFLYYRQIWKLNDRKKQSIYKTYRYHCPDFFLAFHCIISAGKIPILNGRTGQPAFPFHHPDSMRNRLLFSDLPFAVFAAYPCSSLYFDRKFQTSQAYSAFLLFRLVCWAGFLIFCMNILPL